MSSHTTPYDVHASFTNAFDISDLCQLCLKLGCPLTLHRTRLQTRICMKVHVNMKHDNVKHNMLNTTIHTHMNVARRRKRGRRTGRQEGVWDQSAASKPGHPNSSGTRLTRQRQASGGITRDLSNRRPPPTTNDTKRQNANAIMIFVGGRGTKHAMLGAKIMAFGKHYLGTIREYCLAV